MEHTGKHDFIDEESILFLSDYLHPLHEIARLREGVVSAPTTLGATQVGEPTPLDVTVVLDIPPEAAESLRRIILDLSLLGIPDDLPLEHVGGGRYTASTTVTPLRIGQHYLPILVETTEGKRSRFLTATLVVYPGEDLLIVVDALAPDWIVENARGAEMPVPAADGPVFAGEAALAVPVVSKNNAFWKLDLKAPHPIDPFGYALRFAFYPGTLEGRALNLMVGRSRLSLVDADAPLVDLTKKEWQIVELPLADILVTTLFDVINLGGNVSGTFYLDDLRLVAATPPPSTTAVTGAHTATLPQSFILDQNYPNPFNSDTVIRFALPESGEAELSVFNLAGQRVATLAQGARQAGTYTVRWDGWDGDGRELASGVYLYRLEAGEQQVETRKLVLMK